VLLTLLVSFVTSIATGIVTVALMNQAPIGVTQTINHVIERTIEQVTSPATSTQQTVQKETVVVSEDDQVVGTVNTNAKSIIRIYRANTDPTATQAMTFVALGAVLSNDGVVATDNSIIDSSGTYFTTADDGNLLKLSILQSTTDEHVALLQITQDAKNPLTVTKTTLSTQGDLKLGQAVVYIGGLSNNTVATGIVSSLNMVTKPATNASSTASTTPAVSTVFSIETSLSTNSLTSGGLLFNLSGELVGIKSTYLDSDKTNLFAPANDIQADLSALAASQKKSQ
jgi:S1-C subfamily serine protease